MMPISGIADDPDAQPTELRLVGTDVHDLAR